MKELGRLALVEWVDSSRLTGAEWMDLNDIQSPDPHKCISVGFIVAENKKGIILVPTIADVEHKNNRHVYGGILIPRGSIIVKRLLKYGGA